MSILLAHEMGHFLQSRRHRVPASWPYFIPMPLMLFGTMGAVIFQGAGTADRRKLFDIAVSGPIAGLVLALPIAWFGLQGTEVVDVPPGSTGLILGDPPLLKGMISLVHGPLAAGQEVQLTPMLQAGWLGIFITALNLVPIGQLDGGHILYALIGRRAHRVAILLLLGWAGYMVLASSPSYLLMVVLLLLMGPRHPPTADDTVPLGTWRHVLGWLTLAFLLVGFTPEPIRVDLPVPLK
jgi:membrane-associated protease RseP (regulator of RpoE activity)